MVVTDSETWGTSGSWEAWDDAGIRETRARAENRT